MFPCQVPTKTSILHSVFSSVFDYLGFRTSTGFSEYKRLRYSQVSFYDYMVLTPSNWLRVASSYPHEPSISYIRITDHCIRLSTSDYLGTSLSLLFISYHSLFTSFIYLIHRKIIRHFLPIIFSFTSNLHFRYLITNHHLKVWSQDQRVENSFSRMPF